MHVQKPGTFAILEYSHLYHNCIRTHVQNPVIFTKICKPCVTLETKNPGILTILKYSEPWHVLNKTDIQNALNDIGWCVCVENRSDNCFSKALYLKLIGFWIHQFLNKYSLSYRVTSGSWFDETYSESCLLS